MISLFVRHRNAANLLMVVMIAAGLVALIKLNRQFFPTFGIDVVSVTVTWSGASAADVEKAIVERLEPDLRVLNGVDTVRSTAREGGGTIIVEFVDGADMQTALADVESAVGRVQGLPEDMDDPEVTRVVNYEPVATLVVSGPVSEHALAELARAIRRELLERGIDRVEYGGRRTPEIHVEVDEATLRRLNLTVDDVAQRISESSMDRPLGDFGAAVEIQARIEARADWAADLAKVVVVPDTAGGGTRLGDVARLHEAFDRGEPVSRMDGNPAIELAVKRAPEADALDAATIVESYLKEREGTWPQSITVVQMDALADLIYQRINLLLRNGLGGLVIVLAFLVLFLEFRITFWIAMGIPIALLATAAVMLATGQSINMLSLFGLIMALGIVVDDAIVVGEHADHLAQSGLTPAEAAEGGAMRMATPVVAASLTTIATFAPLLMIGGAIGQIISAIPLVIIAVLVASLIECFLILPAHMRDALAAGAHRQPARWRRHFDRAFNRFRFGPFRRTLATFVGWRYATLAGMVGFMVLSIGLIAGGRVGFVFFTGPESESVSATVRFAPGTPRETTLAMLAQMAGAIPETEDALTDGQGGVVRAALATLGSEDHEGRITVELTESDARTVRTRTFIQAWRARITPLPGLEVMTIRERMGGPPGRDIDIRLFGGEAETLKRASEEVMRLVASFDGVSAIEDDLPYGKIEAVLSLTPLGHSLGFTHQSVAQQLRQALEGAIVDRFARGEDEVKVRVLLSEFDQSEDILGRLRLLAPDGGEAALDDIVSIRSDIGFAEIKRENGVREVKITADVDRVVANAAEIRAALPEAGLQRIARNHGIQYRFSGRAEESGETFSDMRLGGALGLAAVYIVLAWALASYTRPIMVMAIIPFGLMGAVLGHFLLGHTLTIFSIIALLGLAGILVNDSVILVTTIDRHIAGGRALLDAVLDGAVERLRPVILTSLTTIGGLLPLLFETSLQAQFLIPMVLTLVFGLATASVLVLVLVPSLVMIGSDVAHLIKGRRQRRLPAHGV